MFVKRAGRTLRGGGKGTHPPLEGIVHRISFPKPIVVSIMNETF